jgi:hypothetical protein
MLRITGMIAGMAEGGAKLEFKEAEKKKRTKLRSKFGHRY